jgi:hypothetical protein
MFITYIISGAAKAITRKGDTSIICLKHLKGRKSITCKPMLFKWTKKKIDLRPYDKSIYSLFES